MNEQVSHMSPRKAAILIGCSYLAMFMLSMFGSF